MIISAEIVVPIQSLLTKADIDGSIYSIMLVGSAFNTLPTRLPNCYQEKPAERCADITDVYIVAIMMRLEMGSK